MGTLDLYISSHIQHAADAFNMSRHFKVHYGIWQRSVKYQLQTMTTDRPLQYYMNECCLPYFMSGLYSFTQIHIPTYIHAMIKHEAQQVMYQLLIHECALWKAWEKREA